MTFYADLHVHSKYSRATSRDLDLEHLAWWAARKGIGVVGTGDCVHPAWAAEIRDKLIPTGGGLFRLRPEIEKAVWDTLPVACRHPVLFMLSTEISTIYKKGDKTRKVHHLLYAADLDSADRLAASLARIGNIASDGRPILGLDSRNLLEIALESGPDSYLVPAHIWTPWFAALGSQSGFDSIDECYGDLAGHIFAVETGLSSDPAMNWRISSLDRFRLTSNSDAHSPGKLGREATRFTCAPDYFAIRKALETGDGYGGTVEFFPEEGKYHMDGHRTCGMRLSPRETIALGGLCPVCGRPVTVGVAHRVEALADRSEEEVTPPATAGEAVSLVPLPEILSEIVGTGVASKAVTAVYDRATAALGPELTVLADMPIEDIAKAHPLMGEAITRLRAGTVIRNAGYDGEYGVIRLFEDGELDRLAGGQMLFDAPLARRSKKAKPRIQAQAQPDESSAAPAQPATSGLQGQLAGLDADQARAAAMVEGPLMVIAGPGSGKTRMLTHRIAHLVLECGVSAASCLAVTFTRKATEELRARLTALLGQQAQQVAVHSFHSLGLLILRAHAAEAGLAADFAIADDAARRAALAEALSMTEKQAGKLLKAMSLLKRTASSGSAEEENARVVLKQISQRDNSIDFDDLVILAADLLETHTEIAALWRERFSHILADEFQDIDEQQYRLLRLLAGSGDRLCVIGDPDQAIYGFRGADAACFERFNYDFPAAHTLRLTHNYRSTGTIVTAAARLLDRAAEGITRPMQEPVVLHAAATEASEAEFIAATIEDLLGGHDMLAANRGGRGTKPAPMTLGFGDCAVLYRTDAQAAALRAAFDRTGIPYQKSSPAPLAEHAGVQAILTTLEQSENPEDGLQERIATAAETARKQKMAEVALLTEARGWLTALSTSETVASDETLLREQVALSTEADFRDARADRVSLLTMHAAKGLEFSVVFVTGLEAGIVPFAHGPVSELDEDTAAEERRLFYVAMTRAKDKLFLTRVRERFWRGERRILPPSPFLSDIGEDLTIDSTTKKRRNAKQLDLF